MAPRLAGPVWRWSLPLPWRDHHRPAFLHDHGRQGLGRLGGYWRQRFHFDLGRRCRLIGPRPSRSGPLRPRFPARQNLSNPLLRVRLSFRRHRFHRFALKVDPHPPGRDPLLIGPPAAMVLQRAPHRLGAHFPQPAPPPAPPPDSDFLNPNENPYRLSGPELDRAEALLHSR